MGRGIALPGPQVSQPMGIMVAAPINDIQTVALIAALIPEGSGEQRVDMAIEILAASFRQQFRIARALAAAQAGAREEEADFLKAAAESVGKPTEEPASGVLIAAN